MITLNELTELRPKQITYQGINYYVKFEKCKYSSFYDVYNYYIVLYKEKDDPKKWIHVHPYESGDEVLIREAYKEVYKEDLNNVIESLEKYTGSQKYYYTYIQDIVKEFFRMYLSKYENEIQEEIGKSLQIKNFNEWDGVIE